MTNKRSSPDSPMHDSEFNDLLRSAKAVPPLPGAFQAEVWRRIETAEADSFKLRMRNWVDGIHAMLVRPVAASAAVVLMVSAGLWFGAQVPESVRDPKLAYVESVSPFLQAHHGAHR